MTHYDVLGVTRQADATEVRRAYLASARAHHPDFHVGEDDTTRRRAARRMQEVNEAWAVLGDPDRRAAYDRTLPALGSSGPARSGSGPASAWRPPTPPPGKGWTPRSDDTGWQQDFAAWRDADERLPEDQPSTTHRLVLTAPVALVVAGLAIGLVGAALSSRGLLAVAFVALAIAAILFVMLPVLEMTRGRRRR